MMENEARHIPHPGVPLPCQPNGRCDGAGPPAPSSTPRLALECSLLDYTKLSVSLSHAMCCLCAVSQVLCIADAEEPNGRRPATIMPVTRKERQLSWPRPTKLPNRHGAPSDRATMQQRQGVLTLRGVRPVTARQACMTQGARRAEKHARASEGNGGPREELTRACDGRVLVRRTTLPDCFPTR